MRNVVLGAYGLLESLEALGRSTVGVQGLIAVDHDDPVMKEFIEQARRESMRLRRGLDEGRKQAFVKFPLESAQGEIEHIWGVVHALSEVAAQVSLVNEPVHEQPDRDPRFSVQLADLEDWMLVDGSGVVEGGYTHLALARSINASMASYPTRCASSWRYFGIWI